MFRKTFWNGINVLLLVSIILLCLTQVHCEDNPGKTLDDSLAKKLDEDNVKAADMEKSDGSRIRKRSYDKENYGTYDKTSGEYDKPSDEYAKTSGEYDKPSGDYYKTTRQYNKTTRYYTTKKKYDKKYGQDMVGDDYRSGYGYNSGSGERRYHNKGIDPDRYGQDLADRKDIYEDKELMVASVYVWIKHADQWNRPDKHPYRPNRYNKNRYGKDSKKKYSKDKNYKSKDYNSDDDYDKKDDYNKGKDKYDKVAFPVRVYKDYKRFPHKNFPTLFNALPWTPIFYDKLTYQTFIYCPTGHFLVLPSLINFFGQRFAVAQLIKWGYASLVSTGLPPGPGLNAFPLVQPAGAPGAPAAPALPYNAANGQYNGGVTTNYGSFKGKGY